MSKAIEDARAMLVARREALLTEIVDIDRAIEALPTASKPRSSQMGIARPHRGVMDRIRAVLYARPGLTAAEVITLLPGDPETTVRPNLSQYVKRGQLAVQRGADNRSHYRLRTPEEVTLDANLLDPVWAERVDQHRRIYARAQRDAAEYAKTVENSEAAE